MRSIMTEEIETILKTFIVTELAPNNLEIEDDTSLFSTRAISSINLMRLIEFMENSYLIEIKPMEVVLENLDSIDQIAAFIRSKQQ